MVNFYHRFICHGAQLMHPLFKVLAGKPKPGDFSWSKEMEHTFVATKNALANAAMLVHPNPGAPLSIYSDASEIAVGAILQQKVDGQWEPLGFFSKQLASPRQSTVLLTESYWPCIWQCDTFDSSWKGVPSLHSRTTNH